MSDKVKKRIRTKKLLVGLLASMAIFAPKNAPNSEKKTEEGRKILKEAKEEKLNRISTKVDIDEEIRKRADWVEEQLLVEIRKEMAVIHEMEYEIKELAVKKSKTSLRSKKKELEAQIQVLKDKKDKYIIDNYLDNITDSRKISYKEPYCLGFPMSNIQKFKEGVSCFGDYPGVCKLANKFFVNYTKRYHKDYIKDARKQKVEPKIGDIVIVRFADDSYHAMTYVGNELSDGGKEKLVSANSGDDRQRNYSSEIRLVNYDSFKYSKKIKNLYIVQVRDRMIADWTEKSKYMDQLDLLTELYEDRKGDSDILFLLANKEIIDNQDKANIKDDVNDNILSKKVQERNRI